MSALVGGEGRLVFREHRGRTQLDTVTASSPLKLLTPNNHGDFQWVFSANFGGGLVAGDHLRLAAHVHEGARALLGTQSSTKVYRANGDETSRQTLDASVDSGASLVILPDPVSAFLGARYSQVTNLQLAEGASLVFLDGLTCGRSARGERWAFARYESRTRITRGGRLLLHDATVLDPAHGDLAARMGRFECTATLAIVGPLFSALARHARESLPRLEKRPKVVASAGALAEDGALVRFVGTSVEAVTLAVRKSLAPLAHALGDDPFARKW